MIFILAIFYLTLFIGMTPMDVAASLLALYSIFDLGRRYLQKGYWPIYRVGFDLVFVLWFAVVFLSYAVNGIWDESTLKYLVELKWIPFLYLLIYVVARARLDEKVLLWASVPAILSSIYAVGLSFLGSDLIKGEDLERVIGSEFWRTGGLYSDSMTLAHSYGMIFCIFAGIFLCYLQFRDRSKYLVLFSSLFLGTAVLFTFTRGIWLGLALAVLIMSFLVNRFLAVIFLLVGSLFTFTLYQAWPAFQLRIDQSLSAQGYDSERLWIWRANWQIFKDHPLFGVGYGQNRSLAPEYYEKIGAPVGTLVSHAHNQYLHIASGTGIVGLLVYLLILFLFLALSLRCWAQSSEKYLFKRGLCLGLIGAQITFLVGGLTEANFESSKVRYVLIFTWALVVWLAHDVGIIRSSLRS